MALIVIDEIHLLGADRGPVLEVIVSRANYISSHTTRNVRIVGLSTAMANAHDLANWLNIPAAGPVTPLCSGRTHVSDVTFQDCSTSGPACGRCRRR